MYAMCAIQVMMCRLWYMRVLCIYVWYVCIERYAVYVCYVCMLCCVRMLCSMYVRMHVCMVGSVCMYVCYVCDVRTL